MKKLVLSAFIALSGLSAIASTLPTNETAIIRFQDEYTEIKTTEVAQAVADAVKAAGATIEKAYVNAKKEYKLEIKTGETKSTVYYAADGTVIAK